MPKHCITLAAQRAGSEARTVRANQKAAEHLASVIAGLCAAGVTGPSGIAAELNARGACTMWGNRHWYASQVARLLARLAGN
jgi:hypothetical protein